MRRSCSTGTSAWGWAPVRALPAQERALDADGLEPRLGQTSGDLLAAGPHAEHHHVHLLGFVGLLGPQRR